MAMDRSPSVRWALAGLIAVFCGMAMLAASIATGASHGPRVLSGIFLVLMVACAIAGFVLVRISAGKNRKETRKLVDEVKAQERAKHR